MDGSGVTTQASTQERRLKRSRSGDVPDMLANAVGFRLVLKEGTVWGSDQGSPHECAIA